MQKVLGFGGFFFKSKNPDQIAKWYEDMLGVSIVPIDYDSPSWHQEAGSTVFAPFSESTSYFGAPEQQWMINFRVVDLVAMAAQLTNRGVDVEIDPETYPNGIFARLNDPEGNPIQLWQEMKPV